MREIKFRSKGLYKDTWYYGNFVECKRNLTCEIVDLDENEMNLSHYVRRETLGQYTGLKDKNGKEIFEGDIVRRITYGKMNDISKYENEKEFKEHKKYLIKKCKCIFDNDYEYHQNYDYIVKWEMNGFYPFADSPFNCRHCGGAENNLEMEIIGNIYDNPGLLG